MSRLKTIRTHMRLWITLVGVFVVIVVGLAVWRLGFLGRKTPSQFDGALAYREVLRQMDYGPRITGTDGNYAAGNLIVQTLRERGWQTDFQPFEYKGVHARNIIARANVGRGPVIILGAH